MTKKERHEAIRDRAECALRGMYHNATPKYPLCESDDESEQFQYWFDGAAESEIDYLNSGGAYGPDYRQTLAAPCNAGKYKSERARAYYVKKGMRAMRLERAKYNCHWERAADFGKIYQYGRGGRTLAPSNFMTGRGNINADVSEMSISDVCDLIRVIESFNKFVADWCASVSETWAEQWAEICAEREAERQADLACEARKIEHGRPDMYATA